MSNNMNGSSSYMPVGTTLQAGKYRIVSHLASGGFGNTYKAKNLFFDEIVAIKEFYMKGVTHRDAETQNVSVSNSDNEPMFIEQKEKFLKEARRIYKLSKLGCQNIVDVKDFFEENGTAYYVMGYIEGQSLSKKTKEAMPEHRLPQREVYEYLMQVLSALEVVHDKNLFHLDLKPGNVMVDNEGKAMLIDFGASKQTNPDGGEATRTALCYTPGYAPIEQMEQDLDNIGPWTDLYSMGATLFFALTGKTPPKPIKLIQEGEEALKFPDDIVPGMRQLVVKLMKPNRQDRFQSVDEVRQWIQKNIKKPEKLPDEVIRPDDEEETEVIVIRPDKEIKERLERDRRAQEEREKEERQEKEKKAQEERERKERQERERRAQEERERKERQERERRAQEGHEKEAQEKKKIDPSALKKYAIIGGAAFIAILLGVLGLKTCGSAPEEKTPAVTVAPQTESPEAITVENMKASNTLGDYLYTGMIDADSLPHGKGEAVFSNSETAKSYKGSFVHGVMDGSDAEYVFQNGDAFIGSFKDGHFDEGKLTIAQTGEYYVGKFNVDGVPPTDADGNPTDGKWYDKDGNEL